MNNNVIGYEDGRLDARGGLPSLISGMLCGAGFMGSLWLLTILWK
jgi:hypothetical protein